MADASQAGMSATHGINEGLEQIREIVVGDFERDVERRLARIEGSLAEVPQEARRRMEVIEAHLRKEIEALSGRAGTETVDTRDAVHALEQRMTKLEDMIAKQQQALRQEILDQAKLFLDELHGLRAELTELVDRELGTIESEGGEEPLRRERRADLGESPAP
jgi:hypothetical protein